MLRLLLVRHGETDWNAARRFQGQIDPPLNLRGLSQAEALAELLREESIDTGFCSDLQRAARTAEVIGAACGVRFEPTPALRELAFGAWEGKTFDEIKCEYPEATRAWVDDPFEHHPPGGETLRALRDRMACFRSMMERGYSEQTLLLVAHGGPLQVLICEALGLPAQAHWQLKVSPGSLSELQIHDAGALLVRLNHVPVAERQSAEKLP